MRPHPKPAKISYHFGRVLVSALLLSLTLIPISSTRGQNAAPTILANVDEVSLDLVVRGKKNKPVTDLKPEDLAITDNGTPVKITSLRMANGSNSLRMLAFVFDRMDTSAAGNARNIAAKILKEVPASGFAVSVLGVSERLMLYQDFTTDRALLSKAIQSATESVRSEKSPVAETSEKRVLVVARTGIDPSGTRVSPEERTSAQVVLAALQDSQRIVQEQHTVPALASLQAMARAEQRLPGRKAIVYFSSVPGFGADSGEILSGVVDAANRSGTSIYTIDVNVFNEQTAQGLLATMAIGNSISMSTARASAPQPLTGPPPTPVGDLTTPGMRSMISSQQDRLETHESKGDQGPLFQLARSTEGAYVPAGGNPKKIVQDMVRDLTEYYEVSYVPPIKEYDGKFRAVAVTSVRPHLKVRAREGYFAVAPRTGAGFKLFEAPLQNLLGAPQLPSDIQLSTRVFQMGDTNGDLSVLAVEVPVAQLMTYDDPNTNLYSLHASIVAQIKNKAGKVIEVFSEDLPRHGSLDGKNVNRRASIGMQRHFAVEAGEYTLEVAVIDRNSGKIGASRTNFSVTTEATGPALSDVVLIKRLDPLPEGLDSFEPMAYGKQQVVADLRARMAQGVKKIDFFSIVHAGPQGAAPARLELRIMRGNEEIAQVVLPMRSATSEAAIPYISSIQAGGLPPGDYHVIESLTQGEKTSEKMVSFMIEGPELASATGPAAGAVGAASADDLSMAAAARLSSGAQPLVITSLPEGSVPAPGADELNTLIEAARKHALSYSKTLPNFVCIERTSRSVDSSGRGEWKPRDTLAELLRFVDGTETRTMLERNGERTALQREDLDPTWALSKGEFGSLLRLIFKPESKAEFRWKEAASLGASTVQVLSYRVSPKHETLVLKGSNGLVTGVGFHGLAYIDSSTGGIRRITLEGNDVPPKFAIRAASITMDYDYVTIGAHDYLMPTRAVIMLRVGNKRIDLNEIAFRGYRRYASQTKIVSSP